MTLRQCSSNSSHRDDSDRDLIPPTSESNPGDNCRSIRLMRDALVLYSFCCEDSEGRTDGNLSPIT